MKVQMKGFVMAHKHQRYSVEKDAYVDDMYFTFSHYDTSQYSSDAVPVRDFSFEVEVPDNFDPRDGLVANLEREKTKAAAEYQKRVTELNAQIQSLLAIENNPSEVV
ncbi:hypothetical protein G3N95_29820 [Paraburkholderia sp. Tr-20389]|uniref:hypothetical protein n=1 Tax=Paraburkholderia sp. Tr-20389 TaxID=2703903 RepID=UPI00197DCAF2|nr:hypothetical protein [Paraburkholderia sp. Tr-20389]MBN3757173.1 hypothetical protein [Paraburkholderia sp. Tr-20389]